MFNIVLIEPEIPSNTGNIARTCAATGTPLHLIKPLGFSLDDKYLKRAGLDYWDNVKFKCYENFQQLTKQNPEGKYYYLTTKSSKTYSQFCYNSSDSIFFVFGKETAGIPEDILLSNIETSIRIPMKESVRSLNLANSVAIVLYEALRQNNFPEFVFEGKFKNT
jgi:tRNA (cytidine/uridine-2'-O-)-methyltransferase